MAVEESESTAKSVLGRGFAILDAFRLREDFLTLNQLAERTGIPRSTTHRIANELIELGLLRRTNEGYELGLAIFEIGNRAARSASLSEIALPYLGRLLELTRQVVNLAVLDGTEVVYVDRLHAKRDARMSSGIGSRLPAHCTALGKILLAMGPPSIAEKVIEKGLDPRGPNTITDPGRFRAHLAEVRRRQVAFDVHESNNINFCVAAPILDFAGKPLAAISVTGFPDLKSLERAAPVVLENARSLSRNYGLAMLERQTRGESASPLTD
ncbi:IclR family transcriptional regulator [Microbacterium sp. LWH7-1.2]|uniref:IclR family transcriptional regulator n=1 Tax=Microbacterium sp. LWH7-1.2 TaxID=3135257 RepID=UPI00313A3C3D